LASAHVLCLPMVWCPSISGFKSQGSGLLLMDVQQGCRHCARQCHKLLGSGFRFGAKHPEGSKVVHKVLAMNRVGHILRVDFQDV